MAVRTYVGIGSTVAFDDVAGTVTFVHTHWRHPKTKRSASPWVVPVGAIASINWREATSSKPADMRLVLRGRVGHNKKGRADLNYVAGKTAIGDFVAAVNSAVQTAELVDGFGTELSRRPPSTPWATKKQIFCAAAAVLLIAVVGIGLGDDSRSDDAANTLATITTTSVSTVSNPDSEIRVWTGTVAEVSDSDETIAEILIDTSDGFRLISLAKVIPLKCGDYAESVAALRSRIRDLLPVGTGVRAVLADPLDRALVSDAYISLLVDSATSTATSSVTTSPTTSVTATNSAPPSAPTTSEPESSAAPTSALLVQDDPASTLNALILADGMADIGWPEKPFTYTADIERPFWQAMDESRELAANGRIGVQAICRAEQDAKDLHVQQEEELDRIRRGPDGELYTDDDNHNIYKFDDQGNLYLDVPYVPTPSTGGGSGGGGGGFNWCRKRWC